MGWIIWTIAGVYILYKLFPGEKPKGRLDREFKDRIPRESRSSSNSLYDIHSRASKSKPQKRAHKQNIADWHMPGEVQKIGPLTLTGGFYYYGDHLPSTRGYYGTDASLINLKHKINWQNPDYEGGNLGYWPEYSEISPSRRTS